jgi:predicted aldo/keto reductase-like oxidoreductase
MAVVGGGMITGRPTNVAGSRQEQDGPVVREYRRLGRTDFEVSDIGFGAGSINNANVLQVAFDMGVNYIDTAEHYANGASERAVGEALQGRDRSSIFLTTKLNMALGGSTQEEIRDRFHRCLERLQTDYVDCLMLHMTPTVELVTHEGFHAAAQALKAEGKVRFLGLSNHGTEHSLAGRVEDPMEDVIGAAAEDGRFDVTLFVYNFLQKEQGERIIEACKTKDMGVTLMKTNPIAFAVGIDDYLARIESRGREVPESVARMAAEYKSFIEAAEQFKTQYNLQSEAEVRSAATRFALTNPGVHSVCPTINTFDDLEAFVGLSGGKLTEIDGSMLESYETSLGRYYCRHACGVCEPSCPQHVPVNTIMRYNHYFVAQGREKHAMQGYARLTRPNADACLECAGYCEAACPHEVPIRGLLARAHETLALA